VGAVNGEELRTTSTSHWQQGPCSSSLHSHKDQLANLHTSTCCSGGRSFDSALHTSTLEHLYSSGGILREERLDQHANNPLVSLHQTSSPPLSQQSIEEIPFQIYIHPMDGSDSTGNGTLENPFKTLYHVFYDLFPPLESSLSHRTLYLRAGEQYYLQDSLTLKNTHNFTMDLYGERRDGYAELIVSPFSRIILLQLLECSNVTLSGLWVRGANGKEAGALKIWHSSNITVHDCRFSENYSRNGGAATITSSDVTFRYTLFDRNVALLENTQIEKVLQQSLNKQFSLHDTLFLSNYPAYKLDHYDSGFGGALYLVESSSNFDHCTFSNNSALMGGCIAFAASNAHMYMTKFLKNAASLQGSALYSLDKECKLNISVCEFSNNWSSNIKAQVIFSSSWHSGFRFDEWFPAIDKVTRYAGYACLGLWLVGGFIQIGWLLIWRGFLTRYILGPEWVNSARHPRSLEEEYLGYGSVDGSLRRGSIQTVGSVEDNNVVNGGDECKQAKRSQKPTMTRRLSRYFSFSEIDETEERHSPTFARVESSALLSKPISNIAASTTTIKSTLSLKRLIVDLHWSILGIRFPPDMNHWWFKSLHWFVAGMFFVAAFLNRSSQIAWLPSVAYDSYDNLRVVSYGFEKVLVYFLPIGTYISCSVVCHLLKECEVVDGTRNLIMSLCAVSGSGLVAAFLGFTTYPDDPFYISVWFVYCQVFGALLMIAAVLSNLMTNFLSQFYSSIHVQTRLASFTFQVGVFKYVRMKRNIRSVNKRSWFIVLPYTILVLVLLINSILGQIAGFRIQSKENESMVQRMMYISAFMAIDVFVLVCMAHVSTRSSVFERKLERFMLYWAETDLEDEDQESARKARDEGSGGHPNIDLMDHPPLGSIRKLVGEIAKFSDYTKQKIFVYRLPFAIDIHMSGILAMISVFGSVFAVTSILRKNLEEDVYLF